MSDWRLVNKEGELVWTSPALPNGGQTLFTVMSPTLILGCKKKGDAIPVNYIKVPDITRVSMSTPTGILLERRTGSSHLLVCNAGAQEAAVWLESIQRAVGGAGSLAASPKAGSKSNNTAANNNNKSAAQQSQSQGGVPEASLSPNNAAANASNTTTNTASASSSAAPKPKDPKLSGIADALQNDMKQRPIARPETATADRSAYNNNNNNNTSAVSQNPSLASPQTNPSPSSNPLPPNNTNTNTNNINTKNPGGGSSGIAPPTSGKSVQLPVISGDSASPDPLHPHSAAAPFMNKQQQQQQNPQNQNQQQHPQPLSLNQLSNTANSTPQNNINNNNNSTNPSAAGTPQSAKFQNQNQQQQQNQQPGMTSNTSQFLQGMNTNTNNNNNNNNSAMMDPAGTVSTPRPGFGGGAGVPLAAARTEKTQYEQVTPGSTMNNNNAGGRYFNNNNNNPNDSSMMNMSGLQTGSGGSMMNMSGYGNNNPNNTTFGGGGASSASGLGGAAGGGRSVHSSSGHQHQLGGGNNNNNNSAASPSSLPDGSLVAAAHRRGMFVELPATQNVNRTIAPNASAVWKEWRDPNGVLYVLHEATGTLQRLEPGDDKFQTFYTDEELDRMESNRGQPEDYHSPSHMEGDTTLDMESMTVNNLQHYGRTGAAQTGAPYPPVPSGNLMREMVVPVPRGQFSPTRQAPVEPLAVPRVAESGYKGKRIHRFTLAGSDDPRVAVVEHQVQSLESEGLKWDPRTNQVVARNAQQEQTIGNVTLRRQWEHVKSVIMQGRYFKKHSFRRVNQSAYRYVFLTSDTAWICAVPTSDVMVKMLQVNDQMNVGPESQQYFPPDSKAMAVNSIEAVVLGVEEQSLRARQREMDLDRTFLIISRTHMLILECNTPQEARFFCDAWNFFLFYSKPERPQVVPQMKAPISYGTRGGVRW